MFLNYKGGDQVIFLLIVTLKHFWIISSEHPLEPFNIGTFSTCLKILDGEIRAS